MSVLALCFHWFRCFHCRTLISVSIAMQKSTMSTRWRVMSQMQTCSHPSPLPCRLVQMQTCRHPNPLPRPVGTNCTRGWNFFRMQFTAGIQLVTNFSASALSNCSATFETVISAHQEIVSPANTIFFCVQLMPVNARRPTAISLAVPTSSYG